MTSDAELVRAARAGDAGSLGVLLQRHRAALYGSAVAILGPGQRAQDAVQDACVVALRRLPELREPAAFGGWLQAIGRNACLMELRRTRREVLVADAADAPDPDDPLAAVEEEIERHALCRWVWTALDGLPESQRLTVMLRHFGRGRSYEEIARICAVPVGTVRSRLNAARGALAEALLAEAAGDDALDGRAEQWRARLDAALEGLNVSDPSGVADVLATDAVITARGEVGGPRGLLPALLRDSEDGVRVHAASVAVGAGIVVLDGDIENPPDDPEHCPPTFTWVGFHRDGRIARLGFHHPA